MTTRDRENCINVQPVLIADNLTDVSRVKSNVQFKVIIRRTVPELIPQTHDQNRNTLLLNWAPLVENVVSCIWRKFQCLQREVNEQTGSSCLSLTYVLTTGAIKSIVIFIFTLEKLNAISVDRKIAFLVIHVSVVNREVVNSNEKCSERGLDKHYLQRKVTYC